MDEAAANAERQRLIEGLEAARRKMTTVLEMPQVTKDLELYPGWTIRHVLAHIAGWDEATVVSLRDYMLDREGSVPAYRGIDDYNAQSVETRQELSYEQIHREWELMREQFKEVLRQMPWQKFDGDFLFHSGRRGTITQIVGIMIHHEGDHADEIRELVENK